MIGFTALTTAVAILVFVLSSTPSWGGPPNPTASDANGNTAGGTQALLNVDSSGFGGFQNTAFGSHALKATSTGDGNTAVGNISLRALVGQARDAQAKTPR